MPCVHAWVWKRSKVLYSIIYHSVAWLVPVMCRSIAICLLMTIVRLLSDLLPLNILNYSQSVDVLARLLMYVCVAWCTSITFMQYALHFWGGSGFSLQVTIFIHITHHNCWFINMFTVTVSSTTSPPWHPTTSRHDVVAMHGYYHHATISQVHYISSHTALVWTQTTY